MFRAFQDKGFQISFSNGLTISVMFGKGNYCEHRNAKCNSEAGSKDAEFAVYESDSGDDIIADGVTGDIGWRSPDEIAKIIAIVSDHKSKDYSDMIEKIKQV